MKLASLTLGLVASLLASACAGSAPPRASWAREPLDEGRCSGPVTLASQADVRRVGALCTNIDGDLHITGTDLTDLDGLEKLHSVRFLVVVRNPRLASVRGLSGLRAASAVTFMGNPSLRSLEGLEGLTELNGVVVAHNGLTSLHGLEGLRAVTDLVIVGNRALTSLDALRLGFVATSEIANNGPGPG